MSTDILDENDQLDKDVPIPLYFQLKEKIKEKIVNGELEPGDLIPSERELSEKYNISRPTIRQALQGLVNEGLLYREKGRGTFVAKPKIKYGFIQKFTTFYDDMQKKGYTLKTKVISQEVKKATSRVANKLDINKNDKVIFLERIRYIEETEPIVWVMNFIPYELCPGLINEELKDKSLYHVLDEKYNITYHKAEITLEPVIAEKIDAEILKVEEGSPIHLMENVTYNKEGVIMDYFESRFRGDKGKVQVELYNEKHR